VGNYLIHHTVKMLEECDYLRCLMIDFSLAFDIIDHPILLAKLTQLDFPDFAINLIVSFLSDRTQAVAAQGVVSTPKPINTGIIQGSGIGHTLYIIMEGNLRALSTCNRLCKLAMQTILASWFHLILMLALQMNLIM